MIKCDSTNDVNSPMSKEMKNGKDNFNTKGNITIARTLGIIVEAHMLAEKLPQKVNPIKPQDMDCLLCQKWEQNRRQLILVCNARKGSM
jgi:hypothetical protein